MIYTNRSLDSEQLRRRMELRRSNSAGLHVKKKNRSKEKRKAIRFSSINS